MHTTPIQENFGVILHAEEGENASDIPKDKVARLIKEHGTIVFSGFKAGRDDFDDFTDRITGDYMNYRGGGYIRKEVAEKALLSTRYDHGREKQMTFGLPLHGEMFYTDARPALLWFYCTKPADKDGQTTACDGVAIYERLSQKWKDLLNEKRLMFLRVYRDGEWQKIYQTDNAEEACSFARGNGIEVEFDDETRTMRTKYLTHAVLPTRWGGHTSYINNLLPVVMQMRMGRGDTSTVWFEDGSAIPEDLMQEVESIQDELTYEIDWQPGDFALIDNSRALHGRRAFEDTDREVYLRMVREVDF